MLGWGGGGTQLSLHRVHYKRLVLCEISERSLSNETWVWGFVCRGQFQLVCFFIKPAFVLYAHIWNQAMRKEMNFGEMQMLLRYCVGQHSLGWWSTPGLSCPRLSWLMSKRLISFVFNWSHWSFIRLHVEKLDYLKQQMSSARDWVIVAEDRLWLCLWLWLMSCAVESYGLEIWTTVLMHRMNTHGSWLTKVPGSPFFRKIRYWQFWQKILQAKVYVS